MSGRRKSGSTKTPGPLVLIPDVALGGQGVFLDDMTPAELSKRLRRSAGAGGERMGMECVKSTGAGLAAALEAVARRQRAA